MNGLPVRLDFCSEGAFAKPPRTVGTQGDKNVPYGQKDDRNGGDEENRTPDPLLARQVLSQLSYTPVW